MILPPNKLLGSVSHLATIPYQKRIDQIVDDHRQQIEARALYIGKTEKGHTDDVR